MLAPMPTPLPPVAPRRDYVRTVHGHATPDPYAWMRDADDPDLLTYLEAENAYTRAQTASLDGLADEIFDDIAARTKQTDLSVPTYVTHTNGRSFWYYSRTTQGLDYPCYCRCPATSRDALPGEAPDGEEALLDVSGEAAGHEFFDIGLFDVSPDGTRLAYSFDVAGDERYTLRMIDLATRSPLGPDIADVAAGGTWDGDDAYCYLRLDAAWRPDRVLRHVLGQPPDADAVLLAEADERFWLSVGESRDHRHILVVAASKTSTEIWTFEAGTDDPRPVSFAPRRDGVEYDVELLGDEAYIVHNDHAPDFALARARVGASEPSRWETILPGHDGVRLLGVDAYDRALVLSLRRDGMATVAVAARADDGTLGPFGDIGVDEPLFSLEAHGDEDADTDRIRLTYESMVTPGQVIDYRLDTGEQTVLKARPVLDHPAHGPYQKSDYVQERLWATADDGTRVPISLMRRADLPLDGTAGCLLYGYGAYEISTAPTFSIARLSLLERGYSFAIAHVRGGGELGRAWYDQGKGRAKINTFTDFIACARHLIDQGYTSPTRLAIEGGSAGGLLIGAVLNMAPGLFGAAHAAVPFVDPLTTILDPSLPLTVTEWDEWGDPVHDEAAYEWIRAYSPYENLRDDGYPPLLVTTSIHDTRVEVTEPAKWVAALRHRTGSKVEILLKTELSAGHGGVSGRYAAWHDDAFELAWLMDRTGALPDKPVG